MSTKSSLIVLTKPVCAECAVLRKSICRRIGSLVVMIAEAITGSSGSVAE
jgi:hypothetical protein